MRADSSEDDLIAWLFVVAQNDLRDRLRQLKRRPRPDSIAESAELADDATDPLTTLATREQVERLLNLLPAEEAALIRARMVGLTFEQLGRLTNRCTDTVRQAHYRILQRLRERIEP